MLTRSRAGGGRFPELYAVTGAGPERIPIANQVQAWTVGAAFALRTGWDGRAAVLTDTAAAG